MRAGQLHEKHGPKEKQTVVCLSLAHTRTPSSLPQLTLPSDSAVDFGNAEKKTRLINSVCASFDNLLQLMCDIDDAVIAVIRLTETRSGLARNAGL